jgi:hypothetical protein
MAFTVSFGNSGGGAMANWGLMLLVLAIFLYFTGMWRMVGDRWNSFFGSNMWTQTISNIKSTWGRVPMGPGVAQGSVPGVLAAPSAPFQ